MKAGSRLSLPHGFSLVELLVVVSILSILSLTLLPNLNQYYFRARLAKVYVDMRTLGRMMDVYYADHGVYPPCSPPMGANPLIDENPFLSPYLYPIPQYPWKKLKLPPHSDHLPHYCKNYFLWANDKGGYNSTLGAPHSGGWCISACRPYLRTTPNGELQCLTYEICSNGYDSFADASTWQWNDP